MTYSEYSPFHKNASFLCPILEYFHPFKHGAESIWQEDMFLRPFIGPFLHHFMPNSGIRLSSRLQLVCFTFYFDFILFYFRSKLHLRCANFHALLPSVTRMAKNHLKNLIALMDFFIPVVIICFISFSFQTF